jgi:hypothetical protein
VCWQHSLQSGELPSGLLTKSKGEATLSLAAAFVVRKGVVSDKRMNLQKGNPVDSARPTKKNTKTGGLAKAFVRLFLSFFLVCSCRRGVHCGPLWRRRPIFPY